MSRSLGSERIVKDRRSSRDFLPQKLQQRTTGRKEDEDPRRMVAVGRRGIGRASGDKKTPAGVIMITAVQRKTEYCGQTRMAAVGFWEIGILERHFRVAGCYRCQPTTNNAVFRLLVPWPFVSFRLVSFLSSLDLSSRYLFLPPSYEFARDLIQSASKFVSNPPSWERL